MTFLRSARDTLAGIGVAVAFVAVLTFYSIAERFGAPPLYEAETDQW